MTEADPLDFIANDAAEMPEPEPQVEQPAPEPEEAAPQGETTDGAPPAPATEPEPKAVPITALLDERDRRQKAEREAEELRRWKAQLEAQQKAPPAPDFFSEPDQRLAYERQQFERALVATKLQQSKFLAERDFGADAVKEAYAYFDANPQYSHQLLDHPSPFHAAVEFYRRQKVAEEIGADPEAWKQKQLATLKEQLKAELLAEMQTQSPVRPAMNRPPPTLASAPAARVATSSPKGDPLDAIFGG